LRTVGPWTTSWRTLVQTSEVHSACLGTLLNTPVPRRITCDVTNAQKHCGLRLPHVRRSPSTVEKDVLGRPEGLGSFRYRSLGSTDEFPGAWALTKFLTILMEIHKLVQGSEGHRSENQASVLSNPYCPMDIPSSILLVYLTTLRVAERLCHNSVLQR
jgi:hypothetical protein